MFYVNNKQVLGLFLNGYNYNGIAYGFGKIIPEDRNVEQLNLDLAYKFLNRYRIEYGTVKDGYENALVSSRIDTPDSNGVFHTPFTYYYNGNIILTKNVPILITDGNCALSNALVYNDMNINGAINYFANNTDFQGHNVNVFPEKETYGKYQALLDREMLNNCSNFDLNISTRFSKGMHPALYNCKDFSGNFRYVGSNYNNYLGFRGFLYQCRDGIFNIDCTNMHGGERDANTSYNNTSYYNFSGIQNCNNIKLNINGSPWQAWAHPNCYSSNCNINTYNVISGFSYMNYCNFNVELPKDSKPEMNKSFEFLNNANNCNYNLYATDVNLYNYRSVGYVPLFEDLNNCNINLQVNNTVSFDHSFGNNLNNCNIVFDNIKADLTTVNGWWNLRNCNITGNVESSSSVQGFLEHCDGLNINLNVSKSSKILAMWDCRNVKGNLVAGDMTYISYSAYHNLNVSRGSLTMTGVEHSRFNLNRTNANFTNVNNIYARVYNTTFSVRNTNNTNIYSEGGGTAITGADNCYNLKLSGLTFNTTASASLFENVYKSDLKFGIADPYYNLWRVENCGIDGFPRGLAYVKDCVFRPFNMRQVGLRNSEVGTWNNVWPHNKIAGIRSTDNISNCRIYANGWRNSGNIKFELSNNMQTSFGDYFDVVTANLPNYNMNIKLNVDCRTLNLGVFQAGPPHGLEYSSISADNIYCTTGNDYYVQMNYGTRIYCANFCNVPFSPVHRRFSDNYQPVLLINNYRHSNTSACTFNGGIVRIGRLNFQGGVPVNMYLANGTCMFINNVTLSKVEVNNALLFVGSNVSIMQHNVYNGGLIVNKANYSMSAIDKFVNRNNFTWNFSYSGPWGPRSLLNFCIDV